MCFSLGFLEYALIWIVVVIAVVALIRLVFIPLAATPPWGPTLVQALNIVLWAFIAIAVIAIIFDLFSCLMGGLPRLR